MEASENNSKSELESALDEVRASFRQSEDALRRLLLVLGQMNEAEWAEVVAGGWRSMVHLRADLERSFARWGYEGNGEQGAREDV